MQTDTAHLQKARQRLVDQARRDAYRDDRLQQTAQADAKAIMDMIVRDFSPRRIYQWGSLVRPGAFKSYSDIDIAVEGVIDPERFFALLGQAQALTRFPLDIVQIDKIAPEYADDIRKNGRLAYERA